VTASTPDTKSLADLLADGLFIDGDWVETKDQDLDGEVRLIQLADVGDGVFRDRSARFLTMQKAKELRCTFLEPGDLLVARMPEPLGRACIFPGLDQPAVTVVDVCIVRPNQSHARADWLVNAINSPDFRSSMQHLIRGTTRERISRRNLGTLRLSVPGLGTQTEISQTLDHIAETRGRAATHVAAARKSIDRFRQAVLAAACSGRLTADWSEAHCCSESAADLVASLKTARKDRHGRRFRTAVAPNVEVEPPEGWVWTTVGALVDVATGATPLRTRADYYGGSVPWVTSGAVNAGIIMEASEYITELAIRETNAKVFAAGTLLVAMYGEGQTRGRVAELGIDAATNQAVAALLFDEATDRLRDYLRVFFLENYERIRRLSFGGVQPNLSLGVIRETPLQLPPYEEQVEIVRRVDSLFQLANGLQQRIDAASRRIDRSAQALLAKAFRGDLLVGSAVDGP
jgi:type I restriction enzyme, S subunit